MATEFPWVKVVLLLAFGVSVHISTSAPQPPPTPGHASKASISLFDRLVRKMTLFTKVSFHTITSKRNPDVESLDHGVVFRLLRHRHHFNADILSRFTDAAGHVP